jgi:hypothetical protein
MALRKPGQAAQEAEQAVSLLDMDTSQLLTLRGQLDRMLGTTSLNDLDVEQEILVQLATAKLLQEETLRDDKVPANQKAQTVATVTAILRQLTNIQTDMYNAERLKEVEAAMIAALQTAPIEVKDAFFERYERLLTSKTN